jgi:hypothetical protein
MFFTRGMKPSQENASEDHKYSEDNLILFFIILEELK